MQHGRIDVHGHLIPGVDDGCTTDQEALECGRMLVAAGYTHAFCTPHVWPHLPHNSPEQTMRRVERLQQQFDAEGVALQLLPGGELGLFHHVAERSLEELSTYNMAGRWLLFDTWADPIPTWFDHTIGRLRAMGLNLVLAHPERMRPVQADVAACLDRFDRLGLHLQGNLLSLTDDADPPVRNTARRLLEEGRYFMLGTDLHGPDSLGPRLAGLDEALRRVGEQELDRLTRINPAKLLQDASKSQS